MKTLPANLAKDADGSLVSLITDEVVGKWTECYKVLMTTFRSIVKDHRTRDQSRLRELANQAMDRVSLGGVGSQGEARASTAGHHPHHLTHLLTDSSVP